MSNTPVKVAIALVMVLATPAASFARHAISAATKKVPTTTIDRSDRGQCFQRSPTAAAPNRPDRSVCWAPLETYGPGV